MKKIDIMFITVVLFFEFFVWLFNSVMYFLLLQKNGNIYLLTIFFLSIFITLLSAHSLTLRFQKKKEFFKNSIVAMWAWIIGTLFISIINHNYAGLLILLIGALLWTIFLLHKEKIYYKNLLKN